MSTYVSDKHRTRTDRCAKGSDIEKAILRRILARWLCHCRMDSLLPDSTNYGSQLADTSVLLSAKLRSTTWDLLQLQQQY